MSKIFNLIITITLTSTSVYAGFSSKTNGEFVTASGKVFAVTADSFKLKTDKTTIHVEMDDYDWDADGYKLVNGDQVVVNGRIDNDFLEKKKIEAGSVYVKGLNTYFYANSDDEEGAPFLTNSYAYIETLPENAFVDIQGKVTSIDDRVFVLNTGLRKVKVDTKNLLYNPLDNVGFTKIKKGDRVKVSGIVDENFFGKKEIDANSIVEL